MAFDNIVTRSDSQALMPEEVVNDMLKRAAVQSGVLQMFRRIPVARAQVRFPILSALPMAYWVNGDTGLKQTSDMAWTNKFMNIEEQAVIMPVPDNVVDDAEINVWDEMIPYGVEAMGRLLDETVLFGVSAPDSFPSSIATAVAAAGNVVTEGTNNAAAGGFFGDIDDAYGLIEGDGFDATGFIAARSARGKIRKARTTVGEKTDEGRASANLMELDGMPIAYPARGLWPTSGGSGTNPRLFVGDWSQFVLGVRKDVTVDVFREGVIQDNTGAIVYNLMQQDMTAVRLTFRVGWQVANLINHDNPDASTRYPVAAIEF